MKIRIETPNSRLTFFLPTGLLFGRSGAWLVKRCGRKFYGDAVKNIPPQTVNALFAQICRIKKEHGNWDLVEVESADGEYVKIQL